MHMLVIQLYSTVPEWARERGLDDRSFDLLERIILHQDKINTILKDEEYETVCAIKQSLKYIIDKGILDN